LTTPRSPKANRTGVGQPYCAFRLPSGSPALRCPHAPSRSTTATPAAPDRLRSPVSAPPQTVGRHRTGYGSFRAADPGLRSFRSSGKAIWRRGSFPPPLHPLRPSPSPETPATGEHRIRAHQTLRGLRSKPDASSLLPFLSRRSGAHTAALCGRSGRPAPECPGALSARVSPPFPVTAARTLGQSAARRQSPRNGNRRRRVDGLPGPGMGDRSVITLLLSSEAGSLTLLSASEI
jgi:hypothetical protein